MKVPKYAVETYIHLCQLVREHHHHDKPPQPINRPLDDLMCAMEKVWPDVGKEAWRMIKDGRG